MAFEFVITSLVIEHFIICHSGPVDHPSASAITNHKPYSKLMVTVRPYPALSPGATKNLASGEVSSGFQLNPSKQIGSGDPPKKRNCLKCEMPNLIRMKLPTLSAH